MKSLRTRSVATAPALFLALTLLGCTAEEPAPAPEAGGAMQGSMGGMEGAMDKMEGKMEGAMDKMEGKMEGAMDKMEGKMEGAMDKMETPK